jgi:hypothetical protein
MTHPEDRLLSLMIVFLVLSGFFASCLMGQP